MKTNLLILLSLMLLASLAAAQNPLTLVGTFTGEGYDNGFGGAMTCGDFNNDGFEEFIIGSIGWNDNTGKNYIYPGGPEFPTAAAWTIQGRQPWEGYDVHDKNVGDISGDGIDDFAIPAIYSPAPDTARLDIFFGAMPLDTIPDWTFTPPYPYVETSWHVDSCGDVNGDGGHDFIVKLRATGYDTLFTYIFWGGEVLDNVPDWVYPDLGQNNLHADGIGDINGDGYDDIMLRDYDGPVRIFFGGSPMDTIPDVILDNGYAFDGDGAGVGDVNADGFCDVAFLWQMPDSSQPYDAVFFGGPDMDDVPDVWLRRWDGTISASQTFSKGDFNGDGYSDIVSTTGYAYYQYGVQIYLGGPNFNPTPDAYVTGYAPDQFGFGLASGDVNGDGHDELLTRKWDFPYYTGTVYLYQGPENWIDYGVPVIESTELQHYPGWFKLNQNYPNPFNAATTISFDLGKPSMVNVAIYDLRGSKMRDLISQKQMMPGGYNVSWTGRNEKNQPVASGIYILQLSVDQFRQMRKIVLLR